MEDRKKKEDEFWRGNYFPVITQNILLPKQKSGSSYSLYTEAPGQCGTPCFLQHSYSSSLLQSTQRRRYCCCSPLQTPSQRRGISELDYSLFCNYWSLEEGTWKSTKYHTRWSLLKAHEMKGDDLCNRTHLRALAFFSLSTRYKTRKNPWHEVSLALFKLLAENNSFPLMEEKNPSALNQPQHRKGSWNRGVDPVWSPRPAWSRIGLGGKKPLLASFIISRFYKVTRFCWMEVEKSWVTLRNRATIAFLHGKILQDIAREAPEMLPGRGGKDCFPHPLTDKNMLCEGPHFPRV